MLRSEAIKKMEKILPMVSCHAEGEAMAAALRLRHLSQVHKISIESISPSYITQPVPLLIARTRFLWAVADGKIAPKPLEAVADRESAPKKPKPTRTKRRATSKKASEEWRFNPDVCPGPEYIWIKEHVGRSSKGIAYNVRGYWRLLPGRVAESRRAA